MPSFKQPKSVPVPNVSGYPSTGIEMNDVMTYGKYPPGAKVKVQQKCRGAGAATKGFDFHEAEPKASDK